MSGSTQTCISMESMRHLNEMRINNVLCDASIKLEDETKFHIHKNILSACSSYFRALFTSTLTDATTADQESGVVLITGVGKEIMEEIIKYAYLRQCKIDECSVHELYVVADYFGISGLMHRCVEFMIRLLTPQNCVSFMIFAKVRFCKRLHDTAKLYLLRYFPKVAQDSAELIKLNIDEFAEIVSDELLNVKDEECVWDCCLKWMEHDAANRACHIVQLLNCVRLGLMNTNYFMEKVKENSHVIANENTRPIIIETLTFMYDLDIINSECGKVLTPPLAMPRLPHEVIFAIGGWHEGTPKKSIETYDTRADRWVRVINEDHGDPRAYHGTAVIDYKIFCIGGFDGVDYFNTCRCFDASQKLWSEIAPMHIKRCYVSVAVCDNFIYAFGGFDGENRLNTAERYDPQANQWTVIAPMHSKRSDASACCLNGRLYVVGGFNGQECLATAEYYSPEINAWTYIANMLSRRSGVSCIAHNGCMYAIGGFNGLSRLHSGEKYDENKNIWTPIKPMYHPRSNHGLEIIDDMIFAIGGFDGISTTSHCECYVPETNEWLEATDMEFSRSGLSANVVQGLPNITEYLHKNRENLMEERRQRLLNISSNDLFYEVQGDWIEEESEEEE